MASNFFNIAKSGHLDGSVDFDTDTIKAALLMSNTTADTEADVDTVSAITTLDEADATGYSRLTLASKAVATDDVNDRGEADAADLSFTGLGGDATRDYQGVLIYKEVTDDTDSIPICFIEFATTASLGASQVDVTFDAEGIYQLT